MDPWPLSEKVQKTLQIIVNYTPVPLPKKIRLDPIGFGGRVSKMAKNHEYHLAQGFSGELPRGFSAALGKPTIFGGSTA